MRMNSWGARRANTLRRLAALAWIGLAASALQAQVVYRCEAKGRVSYSYEPCVGAKPVNTTPTQGLDKSSGVSRKGADVRKAESNKAMGDALRPITGLDDQQRLTLHRRFKQSGHCSKVASASELCAVRSRRGHCGLFDQLAFSQWKRARQHLLVGERSAVPYPGLRRTCSQGHFAKRPVFHFCEIASRRTQRMDHYRRRHSKQGRAKQLTHDGFQQDLRRCEVRHQRSRVCERVDHCGRLRCSRQPRLAPDGKHLCPSLCGDRDLGYL